MISGNLTRAAEVNQTQSGTYIVDFSVAVNNRRRNPQTGEFEDDPAFVDCTMFDQQGTRQWMVPHMDKGFKVTVSGYITMDKWQDKQTGQNRSKLKVVVRDIEAAWPKRDQGYQPQTASYQQAPVPQQAPMPQPTYQPMPQAAMPAAAQMPQQSVTAPSYQQQMPQQQGGVYDDDLPF